MDLARRRRAARRCPGRGRRSTTRSRPDEEVTEEIIVTAQKRATTLQDVPFSVAALTAEDIEQSGATNIVEVARNVPGLYITDLGPGQSQVAIRGISAGQVVRDQPGVKESVGIYLDESPVSIALFTPDLDLYDLDRIEVLRGPQGTLFGAGSSSGTVRYITAQPDVGEFAGSVDLTLDDVTDGEFGGSLRGSINVPLGENAAMRAVGYHSELPGFIDSFYPGRETREDVNSGTRTGGRLAFRFEPSENFTITPRVVYQKLETDGYPRIDVVQHPRQRLHHHRARGGSGRTRPGHAVSRRPHRRVHAGRPQARLRFRQRRADLGHLVHRPHRGSAARCQPAHGQRHHGSRRHRRARRA